ncbi:MAG: hypothetical protein IJR36_05265, partial [Lachnospiraceae bacterium]|nr:hypothetical protein [Lachnospiraceae bacterium]
MKQTVVWCLVGIAALMLLMMPHTRTASAAETYEPLEVELTYRHLYTTNDTSVDSLFHYIISAEDEAPLPKEADAKGVFTYDGASGEGTQDGDKTVYDLEGTLTFTFSVPGVYTYEIKGDLETDGQKENAENYTFEHRVMKVSFYIINAEEGMKLRMLTAEDDTGVKPNEVELDPAYEGPEETTTEETTTEETTTEETTTGETTTEETTTEETTTKKRDDTPKTGDPANIVMFVSMFV